MRERGEREREREERGERGERERERERERDSGSVYLLRWNRQREMETECLKREGERRGGQTHRHELTEAETTPWSLSFRPASAVRMAVKKVRVG